MKKRILAGILGICMAVTMFAGCGGKDEKKENTPDNTEQSESTPTQASNQTANEATTGVFTGYKPDTTKNLSNPNACDQANAIYNWLMNDVQGKYVISGLQEKCADTKSEEFNYLKTLVGDIPALRGLDFINGDYEGVTRRAKTWAKMHCLISICWHEGLPGEPDAGYNSSQKKYGRLAAAMNGEDDEAYQQIIKDIDRAVPYLQELQEAGVVVLWRPFHEFDGGWFWWGMEGSEAFVKLWRTMYDRYTNQYGLNNLIWVLGYSGKNAGSKAWYPGDEYVDIIGADSYSNGFADSGYGSLYNALMNSLSASKKPAALHECGKIPNPGSLQRDGVKWLWYMVWHSEYIGREANNPDDYLNLVFTNDYMLTLTEMPDFYGMFNS